VGNRAIAARLQKAVTPCSCLHTIYNSPVAILQSSSVTVTEGVYSGRLSRPAVQHKQLPNQQLATDHSTECPNQFVQLTADCYLMRWLSIFGAIPPLLGMPLLNFTAQFITSDKHAALNVPKYCPKVKVLWFVTSYILVEPSL
jgi:hypothetical protein